MIDAVVTAGGRLSPSDARRFGTDVKALVHVGGRSLLAIVVSALRAAPETGRIIVVGPRQAQASTPGVDRWIDEFPTGEENLIAALQAGTTDRILFSASDLPFVTRESFSNLVSRAGPDIDAVYPIYRRAEFLQAYPDGRTRFASLADGDWTGGSAFVLNPAPFLRNLHVVRQVFGARKSVFALASLLGPSLLLKFTVRQLRVADVERRATAVLGVCVRAVTGADPALAMDCDDLTDLTYVHANEAAPT